jgi:hypothetical protein
MKTRIALVLLALSAAGCDLGQSLFCPPFATEVANNGLDDDCDGVTDECGRDADCDDVESCTQDTCLTSGLCQHDPVPGSPACEDGDANPCTEGHCQQGTCAPTALADGLACPDDGNPCSLDVCAAGVCSHPPADDDLPCDDGQFCSLVDHCLQGQCRVATPRDCTGPPTACVLAWRCGEATDQCLPIYADDGSACTDGHYCSTGDWCQAGICTPRGTLDCDDQDACTLDSCWESDQLADVGECRQELQPAILAMEVCVDHQDQDCDGLDDECCAATYDFGPPVQFAAGDEALTTVQADFNADGIPDLTTVNWGIGALHVLLGRGFEGRGDGTFQPAVPYACGDLPEWLVAADFNADGVLDLAVTNRGGDSVSVLLGRGAAGRGDGTFDAAQAYPTGPLPKHLQAADLDSDGILDLAVASRGSANQSVGILRGNGQGGRGDGTFAPVEYVTTDFLADWIALGDLDADGILDLVASDFEYGQLSVFLGLGADGRGNGTFQSPGARVTLRGLARGVAIADLNADAIPDLAAALASSNELQVLVGQGTGGIGAATFVQHTHLPVVGDYPFGILVADFNRDHLLEVVTGNAHTHDVSLFRGLGADGYGNGFLADAVRLTLTENPANGGPNGIAAADFNGDGLLDLAANDTSSSSLFVVPGQGQGARPTGVLLALPGQPLAGEPSAGLAGDLDLDGRPDVALIRDGQSLHVLFGAGPGALWEGPLGAPVEVALPGPASALVAADLFFDGIPDLAVALPGTGQVALLRGAGTSGRPARGFSLEGTAAAGAGVSALVVADLDGDRIPDLASANPTAGSLSVLLGLGANARGNGAFAAPVAYALGGAPQALAAADLNADAILDLAVVDQAGDQVVVLLGNGGDGRPDGSFSIAQRYGVGDGPTALALGDFNRDHITDLAVANTAAGTLSVLLGGGSGGRGDGTFGAASPVAACAEPRDVRAVDLDGDDILDLLAACAGDGSVVRLRGQGANGRGDGTFAAPVATAVGGRPVCLLATDQEPNGVQDAIALCRETDELVLLLGQADCASVP